MAAGKIGNLSVGLALDTAEFSRGLTKAESDAKRFAENVQKVGAEVGTLLGAGAAAAVAGLVYTVKSAIDAADELNKMSKKAGVAVDTLGGIGFAASQAGGDLQSAVAATGKLNKSLAEAAAGNKEAADAFDVLGISVKDSAGNTKLADVALAEIADKFKSYADGPEKAALALRIFGKAGADLIPLLNDGGGELQKNIDYYKRYAGVTQEVADQAQLFNDTLGKLSLLQGAFARQIAAEVLPILQAIADEFLNAKEKSNLFETAAGALRTVLETLVVTGATVKDTFVGVGDTLGAYAAVSARLLQGDVAGAKAIGEAYRQAGEERKKALAGFTSNVLARPGPAEYSNEGRGRAAPKPGAAPRLRVAGAGGGGSADDPAKKLLENSLKAQERLINEERDLAQSRNKFLDLYNDQNLLSIRSYYDAKRTISEAATSSQIAIYDREIAALKAYQAKTAKATDKADAQGKIDTILEKRSKLQQDAGELGIELAIKQAREEEDLAKSLVNVNAQILELRGNLAEAAGIRFDQQNGDLVKKFTANGNAEAVKALATLRQYTIAQADFTKLTTNATLVSDQLAAAEDRVSIAQQLGATTSLGALQQVSQARQKAVQDLEAIVAAQEAVALASGNPALIAQAQKARLELDKLRASADLVGQKFQSIFVDSASSALGDFITGSKSAKAAFTDFANSVSQQIARIAAQNIAESVFGKGGAGGGFGDFFAKAFGGGGSGGSTGGAAGGSAAGSGILQSLGSLFAGFFADGGRIAPGQWGIAGEAGPEPVFGGTTGATVQSASMGREQRPIAVTVVQNFAPGTTRATTDQAAVAAGREASRAIGRGNA